MDRDSLETLSSAPQSDFLSLVGSIFSGIRCKFLVMLFVFFLLISSDVFVNRVLSKVDAAVSMGHPTSYGTVLQGLLLVICALGLDGLTRTEVI